MYAKQTQKLRRRAGAWLRELREKRGLSQRGRDEEAEPGPVRRSCADAHAASASTTMTLDTQKTARPISFPSWIARYTVSMP